MNDKELVARIKKLVLEERELCLEILKYLRLVEARKIYLQMGCSSLFKFAVRELGYSEDEAYRRVAAMQLIKNSPEIETKIASGKVSLTNAAKIQNYFKLAKEVSPEVKLQFVTAMENKTTREVERELVKLNPELAPGERVRRLNENKTEVRLVLEDAVMDKLDRLKALRSHKNPQMNYAELLAELVELGLNKYDPVRKKERRSVSGAQKNTQTSAQTNPLGSKNLIRRAARRSRYIPARIKARVWKRDNSSCTYIDPVTNKKCDSTHLLQMDHIELYAFGGANTEKNLRLLCAAHNQWRAEKYFGKSSP